MGKRDDLVRAIQARYVAIRVIGAQIDADLAALIDEYLATIEDVTGLKADPSLREELRREVLEMALGPVLSQAQQLDEAARELNRDVEELDPVGFVYLGPLDGLMRPFCETLHLKWFTWGEIEDLDNAQLPDAFATRGGYNCRHGWYAIFAGEENEFTRGTAEDIERANRRAKEGR